jgi:molybdopterin/thiamine biosynthesis adenylyltransferase/rhodanese-related sulfurtransferase
MTRRKQDGDRSQLSHEEILRYSRQLLLPEVGLEGQRQLKSASVLIVGTGGLGSPAAMYLAAAGLGRIGLVDCDAVEATNLQRQIIHGTSHLGKPKVLSARDRLTDINPGVQVDIYDQVFDAASARTLAEPYDLIIDASDNFPTRYLINDVCVLSGKPNVHGSVFRFEGQASVFWAKHGPCYRCLFPDPPPPGLMPSCDEGGVFGVLAGTIGTLQAAEAIKLVLDIGESLIDRLLLFDALQSSFDVIHLRKNPDCRICSDQPEITELIDYPEFCGVPGHDRLAADLDAGLEIDAKDLALRMERGEPIRLIDVREPHEQAISKIDGEELIPLGTFAARMHELGSDEEIVLFCKSGSRSARAVGLLLRAGFRKVKNLRGGINAWARDVDPQLPTY